MTCGERESREPCEGEDGDEEEQCAVTVIFCYCFIITDFQS